LERRPRKVATTLILHVKRAAVAELKRARRGLEEIPEEPLEPDEWALRPRPGADVAILGRYRRLDGSVPIFVAAESAAFRERFGPIAARFPNGTFPLDDSTPLGPLVRSSHLAVEPPQLEMPLHELSGALKKFVTEAFFNNRCYFLTFAPATRLRRGPPAPRRRRPPAGALFAARGAAAPAHAPRRGGHNQRR
jgi:hypothetical protein